MKKGTKIILIIVGILILIGLAYYFLVYKPSKASERGGSNGSNGSNGNTSSLSVGSDVYLNSDKSIWASGSGIPVYRKNVADSQGSFLEGTTRADWMPGWNIGKVVELQPGWAKVKLNNFQIWKFTVASGYTNQIAKLTGDYWFSDKAVIKL